MPVHHVDVDPVGAGGVDRAHFLAELGEVGGQDRWGDERAAMEPIRRDQPRADKARHEEAVETAFRFEQAGQDPDPAFRRWRHEVGQLAASGGSIAKSGMPVEEGADDLLAFLRLERADRIDERCRRA